MMVVRTDSCCKAHLAALLRNDTFLSDNNHPSPIATHHAMLTQSGNLSAHVAEGASTLASTVAHLQRSSWATGANGPSLRSVYQSSSELNNGCTSVLAQVATVRLLQLEGRCEPELARFPAVQALTLLYGFAV